NSMSDPAVNRPPRPSFDVVPRPDQDPLAVLFDASRSVDPDGEIIRYEWRFGDGRTAEGRIVTHIYLSAGEYETVLDVVDDGGAVASATSSFVLTAGTGGGLQLPGDGNQDGRLDLSDAVSLLTRLFIDASSPLPCEPDDVYAPGNRTLLDVNADGGINLTDAVHILNFLFLAGPEPALGTSCIPIEGCPNVCVR
ncbi:MAG: PKD domain-containing protein, partial [Planctomycetes bacterium]|nr:PKD domain-containing protein [Planctomycetota bacterium]